MRSVLARAPGLEKASKQEIMQYVLPDNEVRIYEAQHTRATTLDQSLLDDQGRKRWAELVAELDTRQQHHHDVLKAKAGEAADAPAVPVIGGPPRLSHVAATEKATQHLERMKREQEEKAAKDELKRRKAKGGPKRA